MGLFGAYPLAGRYKSRGRPNRHRIDILQYFFNATAGGIMKKYSKYPPAQCIDN